MNWSRNEWFSVLPCIHWARYFGSKILYLEAVKYNILLIHHPGIINLSRYINKVIKLLSHDLPLNDSYLTTIHIACA